MLPSHGYALIPTSTLGRVASRPGLGAALSALVFLAGCQAPGHKMTMRPNSHERPENVQGLSVTLHALTPDLVRAQAAKPPVPANLDGLLKDKLPVYRVGPQDVLLATVWDHPEISLPMGQYRTDQTSGSVVEDDGSIFFPYVGKLKVAGMSVGEIRDALTVQLAKVLRNPQVDVKIIAFRSQKIYVGGEVRNPAVYNVTDVPFTLAEAVARAGGFLPTADDSHLILNRGSRSWYLNFHGLMGAGKGIGQVVLQDGDSLQVPSATEEPVYLMGEFMRPGNVPLTHGTLSLAKAISEAGGLQMTGSDATSIYVIRAGDASNTVDVYHLDGRNPASMVLADKFALVPHDIVYVDAGTLTRFGRVMNALIPTINATTQTGSAWAQVYYFKKRL